MPLTFATPQTVEAAKQARTVQNVGINIRLPLVGPGTVSFYFVSLDAAGKEVESRPVHMTVAALKAKYPADFATVYGILKKVAYQEAQDAGLYPKGTVT